MNVGFVFLWLHETVRKILKRGSERYECLNKDSFKFHQINADPIGSQIIGKSNLVKLYPVSGKKKYDSGLNFVFVYTFCSLIVLFY